MKELKTNAMRLLEKESIPYTVHSYDPDDGGIDGISVAAKIGRSIDEVFKTLVTRGGAGIYVFVVPVACELNLKAAAKAVGERSVEMIKVSEITPLTGYIKGGCSPVGMKKLYTTVIDETATLLDTMVVSAGKIGWQIELDPQALCKLTNGSFCDIT